MFDYKHYVPIVRWKAGERTALRELYDDDKAGLTPLIEIPADNIEKALNWPPQTLCGKSRHSYR